MKVYAFIFKVLDIKKSAHQLILIMLSFLLLCFSLWTQTAFAEFYSGKDFRELSENLYFPVNNPKAKVFVEEVFSFACPHCAHIGTLLPEWKRKLPSTVQWMSSPAVFKKRKKWYQPFAKFYFALDHYHMLDDPHKLLVFGWATQFTQLKNSPQSDANMSKMMNTVFGLDKKEIKTFLSSNATEVKVNEAQRLTDQIGIDSIPAFIVSGINGQYIVTRSMIKDADGNFDPQKMLDVVDYLVQIVQGKMKSFSAEKR